MSPITMHKVNNKPSSLSRPINTHQDSTILTAHLNSSSRINGIYRSPSSYLSSSSSSSSSISCGHQPLSNYIDLDQQFNNEKNEKSSFKQLHNNQHQHQRQQQQLNLPSEIQRTDPPPMPDSSFNRCHSIMVPPPPPPPINANGNDKQLAPSPNEFGKHPIIDQETVHPSVDLINIAPVKPNAKMKSFNWKKIPKRKVLSSFLPDSANNYQADRLEKNGQQTNIWYLIAKANNALKEIPNNNKSMSNSTSSNGMQSNLMKSSKIRDILNSVRRKVAAVQSCSNELDNSHQQQSKILAAINFDDLESLFRLPQQQQIQTPPLGSSLGIESPNFTRQASLRTNASSDGSYYCDDQDRLSIDDQSAKYIPLDLLDGKKSLNVNIFLKQCKISHDQLIQMINDGKYNEIGKEKLDSLIKILPDANEERSLLNVASITNKRRLPLAEGFLLRLTTKVPNYRLRLESMLLQEEYETNFTNMKNSVKTIELAAKEIQHSQQFRDILNVVLVTGNFLNAGGYAADAAGFTLECLGRLGEVRSNKPGVFLVHYVAEVAERLNLSNFMQNDMPNIESASKVCVASLRAEVNSFNVKLTTINNMLNECESSDNDTVIDINCGSNGNSIHYDTNTKQLAFLNKLQGILDAIRLNTDVLRREINQELEEIRIGLANYLCEDINLFKFSECFNTLITFNQRLRLAIEENCRRKESEKRMEARKNNCCNRRNSMNERDLTNLAMNRSILQSTNCDDINYLEMNDKYNSNAFGQSHLSMGHLNSDSSNKFKRTNTKIVDGDSISLHNDLIEMLSSTKIDLSSTSSQNECNFRHQEPFGTMKRTKRGLKSTVSAYFKSCEEEKSGIKESNGGSSLENKSGQDNSSRSSSHMLNPSNLESLFSRERDSTNKNNDNRMIRSLSMMVANRNKSTVINNISIIKKSNTNEDEQHPATQDNQHSNQSSQILQASESKPKVSQPNALRQETNDHNKEQTKNKEVKIKKQNSVIFQSDPRLKRQSTSSTSSSTRTTTSITPMTREKRCSSFMRPTAASMAKLRNIKKDQPARHLFGN